MTTEMESPRSNFLGAMSEPAHERSVPVRGIRRGTNSTIRHLRHPYGDTVGSSRSRKRDRFEAIDNLSPSDSEESYDLEDAIKSSWDSDSSEDTALSRHRLSRELENTYLQDLMHQLADRAFPALSQWITAARYIVPPAFRISSPKRSRSSSDRSILMETSDPNDPSTILILRVDGYFPLACPFAVFDPSLHRSCNLQHHLRSIVDVIKHLQKHHPNPFYCPICGEIFDSEPAGDRHIRVRSCAPRVLDITKGVSLSTLMTIIRRDYRARHQPEEDRWWRIYSILFPDAERQQHGDAYLEEGLPLAVSMARDFWGQHGRRFVGEYLAEVKGSSSDMNERILGEEGISTIGEMVGRELIQRVIAHYVKGGDQCSVSKSGGKENEDGWVIMKAEHN
ncbi:hypothetical protein QBC40DRAFT_279027 [Triangularia verruculosa]|uniref:C2H2-type domain-containing protein n=1 Tax=Triangularia verruculosa TaxID=2587418 RepID=A0AAN6XIT4_9PEZI|nr:hypothetical protein QBC40DRAFT_279027 [Triangularia verruculosa]